MPAIFDTCPKCGHRRVPGEMHAPEQCPACGLYFAKWMAHDSFVPPALHAHDKTEDEEYDWRDELRERIEHVPATVTDATIWGRAALLLFFAVWGVRLAAMDYRDGEMGNSFMHNILLAIHEAGHVIFIPCGEFMTILGGSLFQILLPLIAAATILWQNRDAYGAALGIWWAGVSLMDLAPYIYDAKQPQLILLGGHTGEDGPHDWIYLLGVFGKVHHSQAYGFWAHKLGLLLMLLGLCAAGAALWRWRKSREQMDSP
jgi:hypothetical protein